MKINHPRDIPEKSVPKNPTSTPVITHQRDAKTKTFANHFFSFFSSIPILPSLLNFTIDILSATSSKLYSLVCFLVPKKEVINSKVYTPTPIDIQDIHLISTELAEISKNIEKALIDVQTTTTPIKNFMTQYSSITDLLKRNFKDFENLTKDPTFNITSKSQPLAIKIRNFSTNIPELSEPFDDNADDFYEKVQEFDNYEQSKASLSSIIANLSKLQIKSLEKFVNINKEVKDNKYSGSIKTLTDENFAFEALIRESHSIIPDKVLTKMKDMANEHVNYIHINLYRDDVK